MRMEKERFTTGWDSLDAVLRGILPGDNVVWHVDDLRDYARLIPPLQRAARKHGRPFVYYRFAPHPALAAEADGTVVRTLDPQAGFEQFVASVHDAIDRAGRGAYHLFDDLSHLAAVWHSDAMLGNFFVLTCPYLFDLETLTYFGLRRGAQGPDALDPILETTQIFLDVYAQEGRSYLRPRKTQHRYSPTISMLHTWEGERFEPVASSIVAARVLTIADRGAPDGGGTPTVTPAVPEFERRLRQCFAGEGPIAELARRYLTVEDLREVARRMIGTGRIGGKAVGMLVARAILRRDAPHIAERLEPHDSFYVGSDVFYTYLVQNGVWWLRLRQNAPDLFLKEANLARRRILSGKFTDRVVGQFSRLIEYFGQSAFIVRSSSLLEDSYGHAFAGKYESLFCANQGPYAQRLADFLAAARAIYASSMSERALRYRAERGLLEADEQMALLVMRVSGTMSGRRFYPPVAGVGFSFNPYVWHPDIDPAAGVVRLVFGLGTRAVNRTDDDYTRLVALNAPTRRPEANFEEVRRYAQRRVDVIDLDANQVVSARFDDIAPDPSDLLPLDLLAAEEPPPEGRTRRTPSYTITFDRLLTETRLVADLREMLRALEQAYGCPVDTEFTVNFLARDEYRINLLQCRPLQVQGWEGTAEERPEPAPDRILFEARDAVIGHSRSIDLDWVVYVTPAAYAGLPPAERYQVARLLGELNRAFRTASGGSGRVLMAGPGRWGTTSPSLGLPVAFAEINQAAALIEIVAMHEHLIPDASLGTHFLNDLVEMDILYAALRPDRPPNRWNEEPLRAAPNRLLELLPSAERWLPVVRVVRGSDIAPGQGTRLFADARRQQVLCYLQPAARKDSCSVPGAG